MDGIDVIATASDAVVAADIVYGMDDVMQLLMVTNFFLALLLGCLLAHMFQQNLRGF